MLKAAYKEFSCSHLLLKGVKRTTSEGLRKGLNKVFVRWRERANYDFTRHKCTRESRRSKRAYWSRNREVCLLFWVPIAGPDLWRDGNGQGGLRQSGSLR